MRVCVNPSIILRVRHLLLLFTNDGLSYIMCVYMHLKQQLRACVRVGCLLRGLQLLMCVPCGVYTDSKTLNKGFANVLWGWIFNMSVRPIRYAQCVVVTNERNKTVLDHDKTSLILPNSSTGALSVCDCVSVLPCRLCSRCLLVYCSRLLSAPQGNDTAVSGCHL